MRVVNCPLATAIFATLAAVWSGASPAQSCVKENATIDLHGTITREAFPGPPNYQSIDRGDAPEIIYVLTSDTQHNICANDMETGESRMIGQVQRFQLAFSPKNAAPVLPVVFGRAHVRGKLIVGVTGHYHTPAAVEVRAFEGSDAWSPKAIRAASDAPESVPVTVAFLHALLGPSLIAQMKNQSKQTLSVLVAVVNPTTGVRRTFAIVMQPHGYKNIGHMEGWPFASGDRMLLRNASFTDIAVQVP